MEEFNYFSDDFLSNGEFQQLYSSFEYSEDICLWDNRNFIEQPRDNVENVDLNNTNYHWTKSLCDFSNTNNNTNGYVTNCADSIVAVACNSLNEPSEYNYYQNSEYSTNESNHSSSTPSSSSELLNRQYGSLQINTNNIDHLTNANFPSEDFLTDMDKWKRDHIDDLLYQADNNTDWELNLENLLFDSAFDASIPVVDLPDRTFFCNDSCTVFLKESSEHLNTNLQNFRPLQRQTDFTSTVQLIPSTILSSKSNETAPDEEKAFTCTYGDCRKVYAKAGHLKAHLRRHVGDKPYVCHWPNCTWKFSRSDELSRHRRSHSGIKPYKCDYCPKCFSRSDHLTKHRKVHERKMAAMKIKAVWTSLPQGKPGRKPKTPANHPQQTSKI